MNRTGLYQEHLKLNAKMVDFHGWEMPLYYSSILDEHAAVRKQVGLFDISHMGQVHVTGRGALETLNRMVVSDLAQAGDHRACYTLIPNEQGGLVDDIIVYRFNVDDYVVIINCANREKDLAWMTARRQPDTQIEHISHGRAILAVQGPSSGALLHQVLGVAVDGLGRFALLPLSGWGKLAWVARTGYTGSDGFEVFLEDAHAIRLWKKLLEAGASVGLKPIGLGARDTLRLEAGLRLYGTDMDDSTSPYEADLGWTVAIGKPPFTAQEILKEQKAHGVARKLVGFELAEGPVPRHGFAMTLGGKPIGHVTSGTFSPMLNKPIGMGYVESAHAAPGTALEVVIRNKPYQATVVKMPFWRVEKPRPASVSSS